MQHSDPFSPCKRSRYKHILCCISLFFFWWGKLTSWLKLMLLLPENCSQITYFWQHQTAGNFSLKVTTGHQCNPSDVAYWQKPRDTAHTSHYIDKLVVSSGADRVNAQQNRTAHLSQMNLKGWARPAGRTHRRHRKGENRGRRADIQVDRAEEGRGFLSKLVCVCCHRAQKQREQRVGGGLSDKHLSACHLRCYNNTIQPASPEITK